MTPHDFLTALMQLASRCPFRETSGYRSAWGNAHVGSTTRYSAHQFWLGRDVLLDPGVDKGYFVEAARRLGIKVLDEGDHLHLQPLDWAAG